MPRGFSETESIYHLQFKELGACGGSVAMSCIGCRRYEACKVTRIKQPANTYKPGFPKKTGREKIDVSLIILYLP